VRLHSLQCADGGFTSELIQPGAPCASDVDATGFAVQALVAVAGTDEWLGKAQTYLQTVQKPSGLYPGTAGDNSNSTALAANAFRVLTGALATATVDPPGPKLVAPITNLQAALSGLAGLAVPTGGFGVTTPASADLRSTTQATVAAAQVDLLTLTGAPILSVARAAAAPDPDPTPTPTTSVPTATTAATVTADPTATPAPNAADGSELANTGTRANEQALFAIALVVIGLALCVAGRRARVHHMGRHR